MGEFIVAEARLFLESAYYGMILGITYDVLRILRRIIKHRNTIVYIEDYLFWVAWGVILFSLIFNYNDGVIRGYVFAGVLTGALMYIYGISRYIVKYISALLNIIITFILKKPLKVVKMILMKPLNMLRKGISNLNGRFKEKKAKK